MPAPKEKKTKEQIAKAAAGGGKSKKKKWNSGKTKEKSNNAVYFDEETYKKLLSDIPKNKLITISTISDKLRITGSLARVAIKDLEAKGKIKKVSTHRHQVLYTTTELPKDESEVEEVKEETKSKKKSKK